MKTANELRKSNSERVEALKELKKRQEEYIERANSNGKNRTCFEHDIYYKGKWYEFDLEMEEWLKSYGYKLVPTGYIGGVWQLTKDVAW